MSDESTFEQGVRLHMEYRMAGADLAATEPAPVDTFNDEEFIALRDRWTSLGLEVLLLSEFHSLEEIDDMNNEACRRIVRSLGIAVDDDNKPDELWIA